MSKGHWVSQGALTLSDATLTTSETSYVDLTNLHDYTKVLVQIEATFPATPSSNLDIYVRKSVTGNTPWESIADLTATAITGVTSTTNIVVLTAIEVPGAQIYLVNTDDANSVAVAAKWAIWEEFV